MTPALLRLFEMRRLVPLTAIWGLAGCAQIFGLDETSSDDAGEAVSLSLERVSVGATVVKAPLDVSMETATFLTDDGAGGYLRVNGTVSAPGTFTAAELTGAPPVQFTLPGTTGDRIWATGAPAQRGTFTVFEHPGSEAPLPGSMVAVNAMLPTPNAAGDSFRVEIVGAWMRGAITPPATTGGTVITDTIDYASFTPMVGNAPARFTNADVALVLRYQASALIGVLQQQLDQTAGTDMISGTMTAVSTTDSMLEATIDPPALNTRYSAVRPSLMTALAQSYFVRAAPGWSVGQPQGISLVQGSLAATATSIAAGFGNPFTSLGWTSIVEYTTSQSRTYMFDMTHTVTLTATMQTLAEVGSEPLTLDLPAGLPITISIDATPLTVDGMSVQLDLSKPVVVDATLDRPQSSLYVARLVELDPSSATVTKTLVAEMVVTGTPTFAFPPELFQPGHTYYVTVVSAAGGFTGAATGDLQTVSFPYTSGTLDSGVFTVTP